MNEIALLLLLLGCLAFMAIINWALKNSDQCKYLIERILRFDVIPSRLDKTNYFPNFKSWDNMYRDIEHDPHFFISQLIEDDSSVNSWHIITIDPHERFTPVKNHDLSQLRYYLPLKAENSTLYISGDKHLLTEGDGMLIDPTKFNSIANESDSQATFLQLDIDRQFNNYLLSFANTIGKKLTRTPQVTS